MKEKTINLTRIINVLCAVLMLALLVCQFVSYWTLDDETVSISGYVWFCTDHEDFTRHFQDALNDKEFAAGSIAGFNTITMLACAAGVVFCLVYSGKISATIIPAVYGALGSVGYLVYPVFRLGTKWGLHLALCIGMLILAAVSIVLRIKTSNR